MRQGGGRGARALAVALILGFSPAAAQDVELTPQASSGPVLVSAGAEDTIYYALDAGDSLDYLATGPVELVLQTRLRVPAGRRSVSGVIEAYGDGEFRIPDIVVHGRGVTGGEVFDARGGVPSEPVLTTVEVPPGGTSVTIKARSGGPDFLVRVTKRSAREPVAVAVPPVALAAIDEPPLEPVAAAEPPSDLVLTTSDACAEPTLPVAVSEAQVEPPREPFLEKHPVKAGAELGLGVPARGTAAVFYYGVQGRLGVVKDVVDVALSVGAYRVGVLESYQLTDPYAGPITVGADYHTTVVPVELAGLYRVPVILLGIVRPFAGAGVSLDFTRRVEGDERMGGVGAGTTFFGGVDVDAGPGQLSASLGWNGIRHDYGNVNAAGEPVRETLATARVDVAWLYAF
jgi:hypothetical protein